MPPSINDLDRHCIDAALAGSEEAWHRFVERYSGLIFSVLRRYLPGADRDEQRDVYVAVLETLFDGGLARYDGRSSVSTWLGVITRSRCMDQLRRHHGRRQDPAWLHELCPLDRSVYRLYFLEGLDCRQILDRLDGRNRSLSVQHVVEALCRIEARLDRGTRRRLAFELEARSAPEVHGRLLEYLSETRALAEENQEHSRADLRLIEEEHRVRLENVREALTRLDPEEKQIIDLRFYEGLTAEAAANEMGLENARRAYTISNRAVGKLRAYLAH